MLADAGQLTQCSQLGSCQTGRPWPQLQRQRPAAEQRHLRQGIDLDLVDPLRKDGTSPSERKCSLLDLVLTVLVQHEQWKEKMPAVVLLDVTACDEACSAVRNDEQSAFEVQVPGSVPQSSGAGADGNPLAAAEVRTWALPSASHRLPRKARLWRRPPPRQVVLLGTRSSSTFLEELVSIAREGLEALLKCLPSLPCFLRQCHRLWHSCLYVTCKISVQASATRLK